MANNKNTKNQYTPIHITHPGKTLLAKLNEMGKTAFELAISGNISIGLVEEFINGQRGIDLQLALVIEKFTSIPVDFWIMRQRQYDASITPEPTISNHTHFTEYSTKTVGLSY